MRAFVRALFLFVVLVGFSATSAVENEVCLECHADPELQRETAYKAETSVFVDVGVLDASVHEGMECADCHAAAAEEHPEQLPVVECADCHDDAAELYRTSLHGVALEAGVEDAPGCADCHGTHDILPAADPAARTHAKNVPATCAVCHANVEFIERRPVSMASPLDGYEQSVHFQALKRDEHGATCTDCHEYHALYKPNDARSGIHRGNIPATCGQCHGEIREVYEQSIHGRALAFGNTDAPTCVDCHGEHEIRGPQDPESLVYPAHISRTTCVWCHDSERIVRRYGLSSQRLSTYADSYHGLADRAGSTVVANCASCHGIHNIRPSDDSQSSVHPSNLPETCGQCHPGAGDNFARGTIHVAQKPENGEYLVIYYVRQSYILLIIATIAGMALHNGLDFFKKFGRPRLPYGNEYLRFTLNERFQHGVMVLSFITLAYSGFALKFPDAWWATPLAWISAGEEGRRLIHRIAALAMVGVCVYHLSSGVLTRRGREQFGAMRPVLKDVRDFAQMFRYYLGRSDRHPEFARFSYVEKLEYWALVWGIVVMTVTGFALWFENLTLQFVPKWVLDLATVIHYYEAWLATLAIVVWHLYWVIFNPQIYPMSLVWLTGRVSEEMMAEEHPLELEEIRAGNSREVDQQDTEDGP